MLSKIGCDRRAQKRDRRTITEKLEMQYCEIGKLYVKVYTQAFFLFSFQIVR
jgi:hypothetical protein